MIHPNVVKLIGLTQEEPKKIVMELCDGTLYEFLHERRQRKRPIIVLQNNNLLQFNEENEVVKLRANIAYQLARGMEQIHTTGICHCDLSSMNVLVSFLEYFQVELK